MAKKLNKNLIIVLSLAGFLVLIAGSTVLILQLKPQDPAQFVALAEGAAAEGDWMRAIGFYTRAWQIEQDAAYLARIGDMWLEDGNLAQAMTAWQQAKTKDPGAIEPRVGILNYNLEVAKLTGSVNDWRNVREEAAGILKIDAENAEAHHALGLALYRLRKPDDPEDGPWVESFQRAVALEPENVQYTADLAAYMRFRDKDDEAERLYRDLAAKLTRPGVDAASIRCLLAGFLARADRFDEAEQVFADAMRLAADDPKAKADTQLRLALYHLDRRRQLRATPDGQDAGDRHAAQAEQLLTGAIETVPDVFQPYQALAALYLDTGRPDQAEAVCQNRIDIGYRHAGLEQYRKKFNMYRLMLSAAEACLQAAQPKDLPTEKRDAWIASALEHVKAAKAEWPQEPRALYIEGQILLAMGKKQDALQKLQKADELYSERETTMWQLKSLLASVHLDLGEPGVARRILDDVSAGAESQRQNDPVFWATYAEALVATGNAERGLNMAERSLSIREDYERALRVKLAALKALGRTDEIPALAQKLDKSGAAGAVLQSRALADQNAVDRAYQVLRDYLENDPVNLIVLREAVVLLVGENRNDEARQLIDNARQQAPDDPNLRALALRTRPDLSPEQQEQEVLAIINADPDALSRAIRLMLYRRKQGDTAATLAAAEDALGALDGPDRTLSEAARREMLNLLLRNKLVAAAKLEKWDIAKQAVDRATELDLDGAGGKVFLGQYQTFQDQIDAAYATLREALKTQPTNARVLTLLGACCERLGHLEDAVSYFQQAIASDPNQPTANRGLAQVAYRLGDTQTYDQALDACERLLSEDPWVKTQLALREEDRNPAEAIERRKIILEDNPNDVDNLLRLGRLSVKVKQLDLAGQYYDQALVLAPNDQAVVFQVSEFYRADRNNEKARQVIEAFIDLQKTPETRANAMMTLAAHFARLGQVDETERTLLDAARVSETFEICMSLADFYFLQQKRPAVAAPWYDKAIVVGKEIETPRLGTAMIRRVACSLDPRLNDLVTARQVIEEYQSSHPDNPDGYYWLAEVETAQGRIGDAIDAFTSFINARPDDPQGRFRRAQSYVTQGRWSLAIKDLEAIKAVRPDALDLRPRFLLARAYENAEAPEKGLREFEQILAEYPTSDAAAQELMTAYVRAGRLRDAETVSTAQINRSRGVRAARWYMLRAEIANRLHDPEKALADYKRAAEMSGHAPSTVAQVLASLHALKRFSEGVDYYRANAQGQDQPSLIFKLYAQLLVGNGQEDAAAVQFVEAMTRAIGESFGAVLGVGRTAVAVLPGEQGAARFSVAANKVDHGELIGRLFSAAYAEAGGDISQAAEALESGAALDIPVNWKTTLLIAEGVMTAEHEDYDRARAAYERAIVLNPNDAISLNNLANLLFEHFDDPDQAAEYARRAVSLAPNEAIQAQIRDTLGWIYVKLGRYPEAIAELSQALKELDDQPPFYYHLGEAYRLSGQADEARHVLEGGLRLARGLGDVQTAKDIQIALDELKKASG